MLRRIALKALQEKLIGGRADGKTVEDIAKHHGVSVDHIEDQMKLGVQVEMEHTNDADIAAEIARDHLMENPDYYTHLAKMEKSFESKSKKSFRNTILKLLRSSEFTDIK